MWEPFKPTYLLIALRITRDLFGLNPIRAEPKVAFFTCLPCHMPHASCPINSSFRVEPSLRRDTASSTSSATSSASVRKCQLMNVLSYDSHLAQTRKQFTGCVRMCVCVCCLFCEFGLVISLYVCVCSHYSSRTGAVRISWINEHN